MVKKSLTRRPNAGEKFVKLVLFQTAPCVEISPGVLTARGIVDISAAVKKGYTPQLTMQGIIDEFERLRPALEKLAGEGNAVPWMFMHEAELALVIKGPSKMVKAKDWKRAVFGYTAIIDVSAREQGRKTWPASPLTSTLGKSFDTFAPIGPCIATADEIEDPNDLIVRFWNEGQLRHNYNTDDMEHRVPELIEFATTVMTMNSGDLIACGTNHEGLGALQDGETVEIEIQNIGKMGLKVSDPLKRKGERGVYVGVDPTTPVAVKRPRPRGAPPPP